TEKRPSINLIYDWRLAGCASSCRAFSYNWPGLPLSPPSIAVEPVDRDAVIIYASWNGATERVAWQVLAGTTPYDMSVIVWNTPRTGFETSIPIHSIGSYFQVHALDVSGKVIGRSRMIQQRCE